MKCKQNTFHTCFCKISFARDKYIVHSTAVSSGTDVLSPRSGYGLTIEKPFSMVWVFNIDLSFLARFRSRTVQFSMFLCLLFLKHTVMWIFTCTTNIAINYHDSETNLVHVMAQGVKSHNKPQSIPVQHIRSVFIILELKPQESIPRTLEERGKYLTLQQLSWELLDMAKSLITKLCCKNESNQPTRRWSLLYISKKLSVQLFIHLCIKNAKRSLWKSEVDLTMWKIECQWIYAGGGHITTTLLQM